MPNHKKKRDTTINCMCEHRYEEKKNAAITTNHIIKMKIINLMNVDDHLLVGMCEFLFFSLNFFSMQSLSTSKNVYRDIIIIRKSFNLPHT